MASRPPDSLLSSHTSHRSLSISPINLCFWDRNSADIVSFPSLTRLIFASIRLYLDTRLVLPGCYPVISGEFTMPAMSRRRLNPAVWQQPSCMSFLPWSWPQCHDWCPRSTVRVRHIAGQEAECAFFFGSHRWQIILSDTEHFPDVALSVFIVGRKNKTSRFKSRSTTLSHRPLKLYSVQQDIRWLAARPLRKTFQSTFLSQRKRVTFSPNQPIHFLPSKLAPMHWILRVSSSWVSGNLSGELLFGVSGDIVFAKDLQA